MKAPPLFVPEIIKHSHPLGPDSSKCIPDGISGGLEGIPAINDDTVKKQLQSDLCGDMWCHVVSLFFDLSMPFRDLKRTNTSKNKTVRSEPGTAKPDGPTTNPLRLSLSVSPSRVVASRVGSVGEGALHEERRSHLTGPSGRNRSLRGSDGERVTVSSI